MSQDLKLSEFRLLQPLRVRWSEIDAQQIVFNGHYLAYFDVAMSAWWRSLCLPYGATMEPMGLDMFMRACQLDFRAPARLNDLLTVGLKLGRLVDRGLRSRVVSGRRACRIIAGGQQGRDSHSAHGQQAERTRATAGRNGHACLLRAAAGRYLWGRSAYARRLHRSRRQGDAAAEHKP